MAQVPYRVRFIERAVPDQVGTEKRARILQQYVPVKRFSESKGKIVEFWSWEDVPLCDEASGAVLS